MGKSQKITLSFCCNYFFVVYTTVHCRTGSLEIKFTLGILPGVVHCRTGSLEIHNLD